MNNKVITLTPHILTRMKHLPESVAFRLVSLKKYGNHLTQTHTHFERAREK